VSTDNLAPGFIARSFVRGADYGEVLRHQVWLGSFDGPAMDRVLVPGLGPTAAGDDPLADVAAYAADTPHRDGTDRLLDFYARFYLADGVLVKVDRATMRVALEARAPFLDHDLVRFVTGLPSAWKLRGGTTKWLLRKAYRGILPPAILRRPKKGFGIPLAAWLKGPLQPLMADLLSAERLAAGGLFRPDEVQRLIHEHQAGADDHHKPLWTLMVWQMWQARTGATL
jgi:asparagine synthase (glutamine-hydrolysing)